MKDRARIDATRMVAGMRAHPDRAPSWQSNAPDHSDPDHPDRYLGAMRRTKIVATIGPASREPDTLLRMVQAGMDVARLNYSHGTLDEHAETIRRVRDAAGRAGRPVAILQDLPGPEAAHRPAARGRRRAHARRAADVLLRWRGERGRRAVT